MRVLLRSLCATFPRRGACAVAVATLAAAVGLAGPQAAQAANVSDVTCNSTDNRIYIALPASDYDQWLWYRLWKLDPGTGRWYPLFHAPTWYLQQNWNEVGFVGGGGGPGTIRGGFLTYLTVRDTGYYYLDALVAYSRFGNVVGSSWEWVTDYSNVDYTLRDRRFCWIG